MRRLLLLVLLLTAACPDPGTDDPGCPDNQVYLEGECRSLGWTDCPAGFEAVARGGGCQPILPPGDCPPGTMAAVGQAGCVAIGHLDCGAGFAPSPDHPGCAPVIPETACAGATLTLLGETTCQPLGDCAAPFPPSGATRFVDASYTAAEVDATHHTSLSAALAAAAPGELIAVESGTYAGNIEPGRAVTVVGRCAEEVRIEAQGLRRPGVYSVGVAGVVVKGVTLAGHFQGVRAQEGGTIEIEDVLVESPSFAGVIAWLPGSSVTGQRVVVRDVRADGGSFGWSVNADEGASITLSEAELTRSHEAGAIATSSASGQSSLALSRTVIRSTNLPGASLAGLGAGVFWGGSLTLDTVAILDTRRTGVAAMGRNARLEATGLFVGHVIGDQSGEAASAIDVSDRASARLQQVTVRDAEEVGLFAVGPGVVVDLLDATIVEGVAPADAARTAAAVALELGGTVTLARTALHGNTHYGLAAFDPGSKIVAAQVAVTDTRSSGGILGRGVNLEAGAAIELRGVSLERNTDEAIFVHGQVRTGERSTLTASDLVVKDTRARDTGLGGEALRVENGGLAVLERAALLGSRDTAVVVDDDLGDVGAPAEVQLKDLLIRQVHLAPGGTNGAGLAVGGVGRVENALIEEVGSFGALVGNPTGSLVMTKVTVRDVTGQSASPTYGEAVVVLFGARLVGEGLLLEDSVLGLVADAARGSVAGSAIVGNQVGLSAQNGTSLVVLSAAPVELSPGTLAVTEDTLFAGNGTRIAADTVPVPEPPASSD
ncbi:MAG: hypothetical protein P1V51_05565 [Deltaproteobacteria bacterium]|nr:hypothetical protein [Deltaproteobacteria bacterium]